MSEPRPQTSVGAESMLARPGPPLMALLAATLDGIEQRHLALLAAAGFDDVRRAHNAVFAHLPAEGRRLTQLADAAGMSKQAMAELVDDLVAKGYLVKVPDPDDRRAKRILWAERGDRAHDATMAAFRTIDTELQGVLGAETLERLRQALSAAVEALGIR